MGVEFFCALFAGLEDGTMATSNSRWWAEGKRNWNPLFFWSVSTLLGKTTRSRFGCPAVFRRCSESQTYGSGLTAATHPVFQGADVCACFFFFIIIFTATPTLRNPRALHSSVHSASDWLYIPDRVHGDPCVFCNNFICMIDFFVCFQAQSCRSFLFFLNWCPFFCLRVYKVLHKLVRSIQEILRCGINITCKVS